MEAIFVLIPVSLGIVFAAIAIFLWAVNNYQFDDLEKEASRILLEDVGDNSTSSQAQIKPIETNKGAPEA